MKILESPKEQSIFYANQPEASWAILIADIIEKSQKKLWTILFRNSATCELFYEKLEFFLNFAKIGISGTEAAEILREKHHIEPELAEKDNVILVASIFNSPHDIRKLMNAVMSIYKGFLKKHINTYTLKPYKNNLTENVSMTCIPLKVKYCNSEWPAPSDVRECVCKQVIYDQNTYIPLIMPGERITESHLESLDAVIDDGGSICGVTPDNRFEVVQKSHEYSL